MEQTIGEQLKQARIKRGLTLDQVSKVTHIRTHYLEALENDQRDALPSTAQARGFLRLYADYLNLPSTDLLSAWEGSGAPAKGIASAPQPAAKEERKTIPRKPTAPAPPPVEQPGIEEEASADEELSAEQSQAIFNEIGQTLRQQREALGLSLAEVERYTRLRQHYIQALEDGRMADLPSPVQGRGMLSNYAAFLNLKEDAILLRFAEGLQARRTERMPKPEPDSAFTAKRRPARQAPLWRRFLTPDLIFGFGVVMIILFFAVWTASRINALGAEGTNPTPQDISSILLTPADERAASQQTSQAPLAGGGTPEAPLPSETLPGAVSTAETGLPEETQSDEDTSLPTLTPAPTLASVNPANLAPTATLPPINSDPLQVYIVARQRAFLQVISDGKVRFLGRVVPGNAYAFSGTKRIELTTGNAAALQVFYNQTDLGTLGISGQAVGMVFAPEGIMTPTAAFTATSTPTRPATITPLPTLTPQPSATITPFIP
jgi:cytoskeletal protein RodZ